MTIRLNPGTYLPYVGFAFQLFQEGAKAYHPMGTPAEAEDLAKSIAFLASDDARMITGVRHIVDGGWHLAGAQPHVKFLASLKEPSL